MFCYEIFHITRYCVGVLREILIKPNKLEQFKSALKITEDRRNSATITAHFGEVQNTFNSA